MAREMNEMQRVGLVRNALLVAGYEMGESGDHWPVINDTIHSVAKCWEEHRIQKNVDAELKIHLYEHIKAMEAELANCDEQTRAEFLPLLKDAKEACDAYFEPVDFKNAPVRDEEVPEFLKRAEVIISTLDGDENA